MILHKRVRVSKSSARGDSPKLVLPLVLACLAVPAFSQQGVPYTTEGYWHPWRNWNNALTPQINMVHSGLIPRGPHEGQVVFITWSGGKRWGILNAERINLTTQQLDPEYFGPYSFSPSDHRYAPWQEVGCNGQAWTEDGR